MITNDHDDVSRKEATKPRIAASISPACFRRARPSPRGPGGARALATRTAIPAVSASSEDHFSHPGCLQIAVEDRDRHRQEGDDQDPTQPAAAVDADAHRQRDHGGWRRRRSPGSPWSAPAPPAGAPQRMPLRAELAAPARPTAKEEEGAEDQHRRALAGASARWRARRGRRRRRSSRSRPERQAPGEPLRRRRRSRTLVPRPR